MVGFRFAVLRMLGISLALIVNVAQADDRGAQVDKLFAAWDKPDTPGATVAVVQGGRIVYSRGYGMANLEYGVRNTPSTVFHVASLSKQFTAFAIHLLAQEGKLSLDDDVRKYLPELQVGGARMTIRHLIHHTSGLRDQWSLLMLAGLRLDDVITEGDILGLVWNQKELNFKPGEEELYSNTGYTLLALIVKRVSGKPLDAFAQERIFGPLGMKQTHFHENYGTLAPGRAYSYAKQTDAYRYVALSYSNVGATSLFTTVQDLSLWDQNFYDARVGGAASLAAAQTRGKLNNGKDINYAAGMVLGRYRGQDTVAHDGADAAYRTSLLRFPNQRLSVAVLANAGELSAGELARKVADIYLEGVPGVEAVGGKTQQTEVEADPKLLAAYVGEYQMFPGFVLAITQEGNGLMVQATGQSKFPLFAATNNRFFTKVVEAQVTFPEPEANGKTPSAAWRQNGREFPLKRVERVTLDATQLQECTGEFYSDELRTLYQVSARDGKLMVRYPRGELELKPVTRDVFAAGFPLGVFSFTRSATSACDGFAVTTGRVRNLRFTRVRLTPVS